MTRCSECGTCFTGGMGLTCSLACHHRRQGRIGRERFDQQARLNIPPTPSALDPLVREWLALLPKTISLTHPDKHDNSPDSNEVTQRLLAMRKKTRAIHE